MGSAPRDRLRQEFPADLRDFLGLDTRLLVDEFKRRYERPDDHEVRAISSIGRERTGRDRVGRERERPQRRPSGRVAAPRRLRTRIPRSPLLVIVVAVIVIIVGVDAIGHHSNNPSPPSSQTGNTTPTTGATKHHKTHKHHGTKTSTSKQTTTTATTTTPPPPAKATLAMSRPGRCGCVRSENPATSCCSAGRFTSMARTSRRKARGDSRVAGQYARQRYGQRQAISDDRSALGFKVTPKGVYPLTSTPTGCG